MMDYTLMMLDCVLTMMGVTTGPEFNTEEMHAKVANFFKDTM